MKHFFIGAWLAVMVGVLNCTELDREMIEHSRHLREEWTRRGVPPGHDNPVPIPFTSVKELDGLKVLNQWPKRCGACGRQFTADEWEKLPAPASGQACSVDEYAEYAWRNCPCGGTMMAIIRVIDPNKE